MARFSPELGTIPQSRKPFLTSSPLRGSHSKRNSRHRQNLRRNSNSRHARRPLHVAEELQCRIEISEGQLELMKEKPMAGRFALGRSILQDENLNVKTQKAGVGLVGQSKSLKTARKKAGGGLGNRRALNDITNKSSSSCIEVPSKTGNALKQESKTGEEKEFNFAEERFLHDHSKCIQAQEAALGAFDLDLLLPRFGSMYKSDCSSLDPAKTEVDFSNLWSYPEPVELPMSEFSDWTSCSTRWHSPPCSPIRPVSPLSWHTYEEVEFVLKDESDI